MADEKETRAFDASKPVRTPVCQFCDCYTEPCANAEAALKCSWMDRDALSRLKKKIQDAEIKSKARQMTVETVAADVEQWMKNNCDYPHTEGVAKAIALFREFSADPAQHDHAGGEDDTALREEIIDACGFYGAVDARAIADRVIARNGARS